MSRLRILLTSGNGRVAIALGVFASVALVGCSGSSDAPAAGGGGGRGRGRGAAGGVQPVVVARATQKDVPVDIAAVGNVEAFTAISVRSQITGVLEKVAIREGDFVKKGDLLFTIDARPFQAALDQANANLAHDQALLSQAEAQLSRDAATAEYQQLTAERQQQLVARGIVSKDLADQARSQADAIAAAVKADKAAVVSAQAQDDAQKSAVDAAKVQLEYCVIKSPIDGRLGDVTVKAGNLVTANTSQIMTISQIEPVFVTFSVPAVHLPTIKRHTSEGEKLTVVATPQDADAQPVEGQLYFLDSTVDQTTDTIKLKATFKNADRRLWPGQFARVSLRLATLEGATVVPQQAVQTGQDGQFVFVVNNGTGGRGRRGGGQGDQGGQAGQPAQGGQGGGQAVAQGGAPAAQGGQRQGGGDAAPALTVEQRPVVVSQRVGDDVVIDKGLRPGETVVTEGQLRLEAGTRVQISDPNGNTQGRGRGGRGRAQGQGGDQGGQGQGQGQQRGQAQGGGQGQAAQGGRNGQ